MAANWGGVAIDSIELDRGVGTIGEKRGVTVDVDLGAVASDEVAVQLVHGPISADGTIVQSETLTLSPDGSSDGSGEGRVRYRGTVDLDVSGEYGLTARVIPEHDDLRSWADTGLVVWAD
jgi:starch phosphorylase